MKRRRRRRIHGIWLGRVGIGEKKRRIPTYRVSFNLYIQNIRLHPIRRRVPVILQRDAMFGDDSVAKRRRHHHQWAIARVVV